MQMFLKYFFHFYLLKLPTFVILYPSSKKKKKKKKQYGKKWTILQFSYPWSED